MIKLWRENKLANEYTISEDDLLDGFYKSSSYEDLKEGGIVGRTLMFYIGDPKEGLNSTLVLPPPSHPDDDSSCSLETWEGLIDRVYDHMDAEDG